MTHLTSEESKQAYIEKMGKPLGEQFAQLWQEVAQLHMVWGVYVELYGAKPERLDLLNRAAGGFFRIVQDGLFENIVLHLTRLTDAPETGKRRNLTIKNLAALIEDGDFRKEIQALVDDASEQTNACRDWRNRHLAHRDLPLALEDEAAKPLANLSRLLVRQALEAIAIVLNTVECRYADAETSYKSAATGDHAIELLQILYRGVHAEDAWQRHLEMGHFDAQTIIPEDL